MLVDLPEVLDKSEKFFLAQVEGKARHAEPLVLGKVESIGITNAFPFSLGLFAKFGR